MATGDTDTEMNDNDSTQDDNISSEGSSSEEEPSLAVSRARRSTAGARMSALIDAEADDDLALLFAEDEDDVEFEIEKLNRHGDAEDEGQRDEDIVEDDPEDVDMSSSSDDDEDKGPNVPEGEDLEGELELQKRTRAEAKKKKKKADESLRLMALRKRAMVASATARTSDAKQDKQQDSTVDLQPATGSIAARQEEARKRKRSERTSWLPNIDDIPTRSSSRRQTMANKERVHARLKDSEAKRIRLIATMEKAAKRKEKMKAKVMTQAERLEEAKRTERLNSKSLNRWEETERKRIEEQQERLRALQDRRLEGAVVTYWSGPAKWVDGKLVKVGVSDVHEQIELPNKRRRAKDPFVDGKATNLHRIADISYSRGTTASLDTIDSNPLPAFLGFPSSSDNSSRPQSQGQIESTTLPRNGGTANDAHARSHLLRQSFSIELPACSAYHPKPPGRPVIASSHQPSDQPAHAPFLQSQPGAVHALPLEAAHQAPLSHNSEGLQISPKHDASRPSEAVIPAVPPATTTTAVLEPAVAVNRLVGQSAHEQANDGIASGRSILPSMHAHTIPLPASQSLHVRSESPDYAQHVGQTVSHDAAANVATAVEYDPAHLHPPMSLPPTSDIDHLFPHNPVTEYTSRESFIFTDIEKLTRDQKAEYALFLVNQNRSEADPSRATTSSRSRSTKPPKANKPGIELCPITSKPAKYRDPRTKLAYASALAYKEIHATLHHRYAWSTVLGCFCGPIGVGARGVPERFLAPNTAPKDIDMLSTDASDAKTADSKEDKSMPDAVRLSG